MSCLNNVDVVYCKGLEFMPLEQENDFNVIALSNLWPEILPLDGWIFVMLVLSNLMIFFPMGSLL